MDSAVWADDWLVRLWVWCLIKANHKTGDWRGHRVERGQFITGRNTASDELGVSPSKWYRGIMRLAELGNVKVEANSVWTMITVCNYSTYQDKEEPERTAIEQRLNSERTADEQRADTSKNGRREEDKRYSHEADAWKSDIVIPNGWDDAQTLEALSNWRVFRAAEDGTVPQPMSLLFLVQGKSGDGWTSAKFAESVRYTIANGWKCLADPETSRDKRRNGHKASGDAPPKPAPKVGDVTGFSAPLPSPELQRQIDLCEAAKAHALSEGKTPEEARELARQLARELAKAERKAIA